MHRSTLLPIGLAAIIAAAACGRTHESKTGSAQAAHGQATVLRLATPFSDPGPMQPYADAVARASHGTLAILQVTNAHRGDPAFERKMIADVQAGRTPLAVVGARVWDTVGVRDFQALQAPFLITSYDHEQRVLQAPLARQMLASLSRLHLTGLTMLPGPFRRMLDIHTTYLSARDFRGTRVGIQDSRVAAQTMRALGATPIAIAGMAPVDSVDGYEQQLASIAGNGYNDVSRAVTTNLALWTRPQVIFGNPRALARLTPAQRHALVEAGTRLLPAATAAVADEDRDAAAQLCRAGFALKLATPAGLRSIEQAVQPIYRTLSADPGTRNAIAAIRALRTDDAAQQNATCAERQATAGAQTAFDGVYRRSSTAQQAARHDHVSVKDVNLGNYGDYIMVLDRGRFAVTQRNSKACMWQYGRVTVAGDRLQWDISDGGGVGPPEAANKPGEQFVYKPELYRGTLTLKTITPTDLPTTVWQRTNTTPSRTALDPRCRPPAAALPR
jgi:C4-dicarboxylate-binding protein DctP